MRNVGHVRCPSAAGSDSTFQVPVINQTASHDGEYRNKYISGMGPVVERAFKRQFYQTGYEF
jgi:hypothetical protein